MNPKVPQRPTEPQLTVWYTRDTTGSMSVGHVYRTLLLGDCPTTAPAREGRSECDSLCLRTLPMRLPQTFARVSLSRQHSPYVVRKQARHTGGGKRSTHDSIEGAETRG